MKEYKAEVTIFHNIEEYNLYKGILEDICKDTKACKSVFNGEPPTDFPCLATMVVSMDKDTTYYKYDYVYMNEATKFINELEKKKT